MNEEDKVVLTQKITNASRIAFKKILKEKPEEQFFAFVLLTLDDALCCYAYANSLESHLRTIQNTNTPLNILDVAEYKWRPQEWEYELIADEEFQSVYDYSTELQEQLDDEDEDAFYNYKLDFNACLAI